VIINSSQLPYEGGKEAAISVKPEPRLWALRLIPVLCEIGTKTFQKRTTQDAEKLAVAALCEHRPLVNDWIFGGRRPPPLRRLPRESDSL
jgi:hypothetical protein